MGNLIKKFLNISICVLCVFTLSACNNKEADSDKLLLLEDNTYREGLKSVIEITSEINNMYFTEEGFSNILDYEKYVNKDLFLKEERIFKFQDVNLIESYEDYVSSEDVYTVIYLNNAIKNYSEYYNIPFIEEVNVVTVFDIDKTSNKIIGFSVHN